MKPIKKFMLTEQEMPIQWYNIVADMPNKPLPPLHPGTKQPLKPEDLYPLFAQELAKQEFATERYIEILMKSRTCTKYGDRPLSYEPML